MAPPCVAAVYPDIAFIAGKIKFRFGNSGARGRQLFMAVTAAGGNKNFFYRAACDAQGHPL